MTISRLKLSAILLTLLLLTGGLPSAAWGNYTITLNFLVDDPVLFPLGRLIPPDMSNLDEIEFQDINPFFTMTTTGVNNSEMVRLHFRFECDTEEIFTINSDLFSIDAILGRTLNSRDLATMPEIKLGQVAGDDILRSIMTKISGGKLREGVYTIRILVSARDTWDEAISNNLGSGVTSFFAQNVNQIVLLSPSSYETAQSYPSFQWSFPRRRGVSFHLTVIPGSPDQDPSEGFGAFTPGTAIVDVTIPVRAGQDGGDITYYAYSGIYPEKALEPNQAYFWKVTASVATMIEGDSVIIESPEQAFFYQPPGQSGGGGSVQGESSGNDGDGLGLGLMGGPGGIFGGPMGGPTPEGEAPQHKIDPIFILLGNYMPGDMYSALTAQLENLTNYQVRNISIDNQEVSLDDLGQFLSAQTPAFVSITISN